MKIYELDMDETVKRWTTKNTQFGVVLKSLKNGELLSKIGVGKPLISVAIVSKEYGQYLKGNE